MTSSTLIGLQNITEKKTFNLSCILPLITLNNSRLNTFTSRNVTLFSCSLLISASVSSAEEKGAVSSNSSVSWGACRGGGGNNTGIEGEGTLSLNSEAAADLAIADLTGLMTGGSGDLSEPLLTLVLWRAASNTSKLVPPAEEAAEAAVGAGGSGCLWSSFLAPGCWCRFFSSFEICSSASSWEDGERPRFCRSRGGGARGRSSDGGEIRADWGNGCGRLTFGCCCCKLSVGCCGRLIVGWWAKVTGSCCSPPIEEGCGRLLTTRCCCCCWGAKSAAGSCGRLMGGLCCCCCDRTTDWFRPVVAGDDNCR